MGSGGAGSWLMWSEWSVGKEPRESGAGRREGGARRCGGLTGGSTTDHTQLGPREHRMTTGRKHVRIHIRMTTVACIRRALLHEAARARGFWCVVAGPAHSFGVPETNADWRGGETRTLSSWQALQHSCSFAASCVGDPPGAKTAGRSGRASNSARDGDFHDPRLRSNE